MKLAVKFTGECEIDMANAELYLPTAIGAFVDATLVNGLADDDASNFKFTVTSIDGFKLNGVKETS